MFLFPSQNITKTEMLFNNTKTHKCKLEWIACMCVFNYIGWMILAFNHTILYRYTSCLILFHHTLTNSKLISKGYVTWQIFFHRCLLCYDWTQRVQDLTRRSHPYSMYTITTPLLYFTSSNKVKRFQMRKSCHQKTHKFTWKKDDYIPFFWVTFYLKFMQYKRL